MGEPVVAAPRLSLDRYLKGTRDRLSSVWHVPDGYAREGGLGLLYTAPTEGTHPLYLCVVRGDNFISTEVGCEGQAYVTRLGWIHAYPPAGVGSVPVYRCLVNGGREFFESNTADCEVRIVGGPPGWAVTA
ncbi:hypothetical protein AB0P15_00375 [Streptomyces sp. NPDC087917]|uniref:hypothetical protein n=1 Tax=Streptomyces sp. NPDC087917 TaxID=3155060 RepID=UPI0034225E03